MTTAKATRRSGIPVDDVVVARLLRGQYTRSATDEEVDAALVAAHDVGTSITMVSESAGVSGTSLHHRLDRLRAEGRIE